jgi:hypothetical protein
MKRALLVTLIVLAVLAGVAFAQTPKKPEIVGTWVGTAVVGNDGSEIELTVVIDKTDAGYAGKISDVTGMVPETPLKEIVFKDNKLAFELDLAQATGTTLIKIELLLEGETLKGAWSDPEGSSGAISLALKR